MRATCRLKTNNAPIHTQYVNYFEMLELTNIRHTIDGDVIVIVTQLKRRRSHFRQYMKLMPSNEKLIVRIFQ